MVNAVAKIVRRAKSNFFWSFVFLDQQKRGAIFAAYAFARHTDDLVDDAPSLEEAKARLKLWREELQSCYAGSPSSDITVALLPVVSHYNIPKEYFDDLIKGVEMDLSQNRYESFEDLETYCYRVASVVGLICIEIFGYQDESTKAYAVDLGMALQLTNILRDVGEDAGRDRIYLPQDELEQYGCTEESILRLEHTEAFEKMLTHQCQRARAYYVRAQEKLSETDRKSMFPAETMGRIYFAILRKIEKSGYRSLDGRITISALWKMGIAGKNWLFR